MKFDTIHEYYLDDPGLHYCEDHEVLILCEHGETTNRIMINGLSKDTIDKFRLELNKEHLEHVTD